MRIEVQTKGTIVTGGVREHIERRIRFDLSRFQPETNQLNVYLNNVNGPRGGKYKQCLVRVRFSGLPDVVVEDTESDLYRAIDRAVGRTARVVSRRLQRKSIA